MCGSSKFSNPFRLVDSPFEDAIQPTKMLASSLPAFPLGFSQCLTCGHLYLRHFKSSFGLRTEVSQSVFSPGLDETMGYVVDSLVAFCGLKPGAFVLDVGSHAGSLVSMFTQKGMKALGIDSASLNPSKIPGNSGSYHEDSYGRKPRLVTLHHVLANQIDPRGFLSAAASLVSDGAFVSLITGYHPDQFRASMFDWIYHEHLSYFNATDLIALLRPLGLVVRSASRLAYKGGSLHLVLEKESVGSTPHASTFSSLVAWERWARASIDSDCARLSELVEANANAVQELLKRFPADSRLVGYGSSHSTTTLASNLGLSPHLSWIVDDDASRHGFFSPLGALEIRHPQTLVDSRAVPVLLAWQHDWRIFERLRELGYRGEILRVMPDVSIEAVD